jgi:hypothetical protein
MSKIIGGVVGVAIPVIVGVIATFAIPASASPACMTKDEAAKAFPREHIYWHGPQHCWDNDGHKHSQQSAASAKAAAAAVKLPQADKPKEPVVAKPSEAAAAQPGEPITVPPVRFVSDALLRGLTWPALDKAPNDLQARAQQRETSPPPIRKADVVIGAPDAAPGSPDYLLEHCCWPPQVSGGAGQAETLRHMALGSAGAAGLAIGLWLFVHRRRQPVRRRAPARVRDGKFELATARVSRWPPPPPRDRRVA